VPLFVGIFDYFGQEGMNRRCGILITSCITPRFHRTAEIEAMGHTYAAAGHSCLLYSSLLAKCYVSDVLERIKNLRPMSASVRHLMTESS
jgi:hypothetical protein